MIKINKYEFMAMATVCLNSGVLGKSLVTGNVGLVFASILWIAAGLALLETFHKKEGG